MRSATSLTVLVASIKLFAQQTPAPNPSTSQVANQAQNPTSASGQAGRGGNTRESKQASGPDLGYVPVDSALRLPPGLTYGTNVMAVAVNSKNHVFVYHRAPVCLVEFGPDGTFVRAFGDGLSTQAHGMQIDSADNIWITDVGDHTVQKLNPQGQVVMTLGVKGKAGTWNEAAGSHLLDQPVDLAFAPNGDVFIVEGHGSAYQGILRFDKNMKFVTSWSLKKKDDATRHNVHAAVIDSKGLVYVGDREVGTISVFDADGKHLRDIQMEFLVSGLYIDKGGTLWMTSGHDAQVLKLDWNGKVLGATGKPGTGLNEYQESHYMTMGPKNEIYVADTLNNRVQKLVKR